MTGVNNTALPMTQRSTTYASIQTPFVSAADDAWSHCRNLRDIVPRLGRGTRIRLAFLQSQGAKELTLGSEGEGDQIVVIGLLCERHLEDHGQATPECKGNWTAAQANLYHQPGC